MWKEKQRQVKTEEEKTKNSKSVVFDTRTSNLVLRPQAPGARDMVQEESWNKHKWVISDVCYRELWTDQAEILIRQVQSAGVLVIYYIENWLLFLGIVTMSRNNKCMKTSHMYVNVIFDVKEPFPVK